MHTILKMILIILYFGGGSIAFIGFNMLVWFKEYKDLSLNLIFSSLSVMILCLVFKKMIDTFYQEGS